MNFERGLDPKAAMGIGLNEKIQKVAEEIVRHNYFNLANAQIRKEAEEDFKNHVGFPVDINIDLSAMEVFFHVRIPQQCIQTKITLKNPRVF